MERLFVLQTIYLAFLTNFPQTRVTTPHIPRWPLPHSDWAGNAASLEWGLGKLRVPASALSDSLFVRLRRCSSILRPKRGVYILIVGRENCPAWPTPSSFPTNETPSTWVGQRRQHCGGSTSDRVPGTRRSLSSCVGSTYSLFLSFFSLSPSSPLSCPLFPILHYLNS